MVNMRMDSNEGDCWPALYRSDTIALGRVGAPADSGERAAPSRTGPWPSLVFPHGSYRARRAEERERLLDPTRVFFVGANIAGSLEKGAAPPRVDWLAFEPAFAASVASSFGERVTVEAAFSSKPTAMSSPGCLRQRILFAYCVDCEPPDPVVVEETALQILHDSLLAAGSSAGETASAKRHQTQDAHVEAIETARRFIESHLDERIGIARVAKQAHMSPHHFCRVFRSHTGLTVNAYTNRVRLYRALDELDRDSYDLAARFGFSDRAHFSRHFLRLFGHSFHRVRRLVAREEWDQIRTILHADERRGAIVSA